MKVSRSVALLISLAVMVAGCSAAKSNTQTISVMCKQTDVTVKINGDRYNCPVKAEARRDSKMLIEATKNGYEPFSKTVDFHRSNAGIADTIGICFFFFPVFGLLTPGAWDLDQTEFNIDLKQL